MNPNEQPEQPQVFQPNQPAPPPPPVQPQYIPPAEPALAPPVFVQQFQPPQEVAQASAISANAKPYDSNLFTSALRGIIAMLTLNPISTMLLSLRLIAVGILGYLAVILLTIISPFLLVLAIPLVIVLIGLIAATQALTAASANDQTMTTSQASSAGFKKVIPYLVLSVVLSVALLIGFILFIVPGLVLLARTCLAPIIMFSEKLGAIASIRRSIKLTNGHTIEMLGTLIASYLLAPGGIMLLTSAVTAPFIGRYQDLKALEASGGPKPAVHKLNYFALGLIVLFGLFLAIIFAAGLFNGSRADSSDDPFGSYSPNSSLEEDFNSTNLDSSSSDFNFN